MMKKEAMMTDSKFLAMSKTADGGADGTTVNGTADGGAPAAMSETVSGIADGTASAAETMSKTGADFSDKFFAAGLSLPILLLLIFTGFHEWELRTGRTFVFPVQKQDNRSSVLSKTFLFGQHLEYRVNYGLSPDSPQLSFGASGSDSAWKAARKLNQRVFLCLSPAGEERRLAYRADECSNGFVRGRLVPSLERGGGAVSLEFQAKKLHRFYLSEKKAKLAERLFRQAEKKEITVSVTKRGAASLQDIHLDGRSLKSLLASH